MNADTIRTLFDYNYGAHRRLWDSIVCLTDEQFTQEVEYSIGSVRNHMVHLMNVDLRWLARLQNAPLPERLPDTGFTSAEAARRQWAQVEGAMMAYAAGLRDDQLNEIVHYDMPHRGGAKNNPRWQILVHVVNHGTDHRAQVLPILHRMGAPTFEQDLMIYLWDKGQ